LGCDPAKSWSERGKGKKDVRCWGGPVKKKQEAGRNLRVEGG